ncbi:threonine/serine exporter ThrE family protein [Marmoricola sp. URHB0036]|uniref:threonine/serine ThrE exporter family protein n=1 Tax=Marmoricola sp. URHB0036 TaxID=1298863 RepID=UPI00041C2E3F|nr:threonine/serine exporter family protein [Marmoricola sp. URHB0036]
MTDARETYKILDLALRIGEILLSSGAGAADVTATMLGITHHLGLRNADIDVTFTLLRMSYQVDPEEMPVLLTRNISQRDIDYDDLTRTHELVSDILEDRVDVAEARARVARLNSTGHWLPRWSVVAGSGVVGGGVSLILGGGAVVTVVAALAAVLITMLMRTLNRQRWPMFYQQIAGGMVATAVALLVAAGAQQLDLTVDTSQVITANIVLLLSGIGFMGAIQDALSGFYLTAGARIIEALLATAGLIAGVSAGLSLARPLGVSLVGVRPGSGAVYADVPLILVGAIVSACAFAFTCYAPLRALPAIGMSTLLGHLAFVSVQDPAQSMPWAAACAAVVIGLVSYTIAGRVGVPPLVVVVPALVPMLPGLLIYRGLSLMADGDTAGILQLSAAAATTIALAAGVILGEYIAQPVKRNVRRLEGRLAGPRMVGVMHGHLGRRNRTSA